MTGELIAEVSTSTDADTSRVLVAGGERITLKVEGTEDSHMATFLTPNEARRIADALATAAAQAPKPKRGGDVYVDTPENIVPGGYVREPR